MQLFIVFLALTGAISIMLNFGHIDFGQVDFWQNHGIFFLVFITIFPRLTLLFSSVPFGGFIWWLGFFFAPRILVAALATIAYWQTNPFLVSLSWLIAISGETAEKWGFNRSFSIRVGGMPFTRTRSTYTYEARSPGQKINDNVVDAEFRRMDNE